MQDLMLKMTNIKKSFSGVTVLEEIDFDMKKGEVHVLSGENGAGKSTLMKILSGIYAKDAGEIFLANEKGELELVEFSTPKNGLESGISMVFQECSLMENLTIAENIFVGREPVKHGVLNKKKMNIDAKEQMKKINMDIPVTTIVKRLSTAQKQCVEIAKSLSHNAKILILDEPTSSLSEKEVRTLFNLIRALKKRNISIVYITHRMEEIFEIGDRITVFRDGKLINTMKVSETNENEIVKMMIGRDFDAGDISGLSEDRGPVMLECQNISVGNFNDSLNLKAYAGEILGIFGLVGSGRTELARILFGIDPIGKGDIFKHGERVIIRSPDDAIKNKIGLVPEDRKELGLILKLNVRDNLSLIKIRDMPRILPSHQKEKELTDDYIERLSIVANSQTQLIDHLSGGNQQKVVISKWLAMNLDVLILDEPTRGVDVGAKSQIYHIIRDLAKQGMCIIMILSDLPEILRVSHRTIVMHDGGIKLDAPTTELDQETIMHYAIN